MQHDHQEAIKQIGDVVSVATVAATLMEWLPAVAAFFTIIWTMIRIYETKTVQTMLGRRPSDDTT